MRIVSHTCSNTEIVCALGRADWLVGVDDHSDFPDEVVSSLPRIGPDLDIDIERVKALRPDLVITSLTVPGHERCLKRLKAAGLPLVVTRPQSLADVVDDILKIGQLLDAREAAARLAANFRRAMSASPVAKPVPILIEWWPKPVIVPGARSWVNQMLALAGGRNPWAAVDAESLPVETPSVLDARPAAIVMSWCGVAEDKYRAHVVRRRQGWDQLSAVRNDRIFAVSEAWLGRPGPRLLEGIERLRSIIGQVKPDD